MENNQDKSGKNLWFLVIATSVSALGGFLFGYDNIVISGAIGEPLSVPTKPRGGLSFSVNAPCW